MVSKLSQKKYNLKILQTSGFGGLLDASSILQGRSLWVEGALTFNAPPPFKFYFFAPAITFFTIITIVQFIFIYQYNQKKVGDTYQLHCAALRLRLTWVTSKYETTIPKLKVCN